MAKKSQNPQPNSNPVSTDAGEPNVQPEVQASPEKSESETEKPQPDKADELLQIVGDEPVQQTAVFEDAGEEVAASHGMTNEEFFKVHAEARAENDKEDFRQRILEARNVPPDPMDAPKPPIAERIIEQTNAEMEAGRALVKKNEEARAAAQPRPRDKGEGTSVEVFRPGNYVPDQKKGQGNVGGTVLRG